MDQQRFIRLLESVLAPDTERVKAATATLRKDYYTSPESLSLLLQLLTSHDSPQLRQLAATQARTLVPKHWKSLPANQKPHIRNQLLQATLHEQTPLQRHSSARVISAIAKIDIENGEWADLPALMQHAASTPNPQQREVSIYILFTILESLGDGFMHRFRELFALFSKTIRDPESAEVRVNTMLALSKMAIVLDAENDPDSLRSFQEAIPHMVAVLKQAVDDEDEVRTMQGFEVFQALLGCDSQLLNKYFGDLVQFMIDLAAQKTIEDEARTQALSFLMQAVSYRKLKIQGLKFGEQLTLKSLEIVTELGDLSPDEEDVTPARSALGLLDLMASSLPPSQVIVPLLHALGPYVGSQDPDRRRAGIMALGMCVEGAPDFVATQLHEILPMVLRLLEDPEVKVRQAALNGVARLADEIPEDMGKEHSKLIPALVKNLDMAIRGLTGSEDDRNVEIVKGCCHAIDSLIDGLEAADIKQYLPELVPRMSRLFAHSDVKVKGAAVGAVGSIAGSAEEAFLPYFVATMDALSEYVRIKDSDDEMDMRCTTCDAIGSIAMAVGAEPFNRYVRPMMEATEEGLHLGHPRLRETSYIFWSTMAKLYESDFQIYLAGVVKGLIECLQQEETDLEVDLGQEAADLVGQEVTIAGKKVKVAAPSDDLRTDEDDDDVIGEDDNFEDDDFDEMTVVTAVAMEKEVAVEVVGDVMTHVKREYLPYIEKTIEVVLPLVEHPYEGTRKGAISTLFRAYAALWSLQDETQETWQPGLPLQTQPTAEITKLGEIITTGTLAVWQDEEDRGVVTDINRSLAGTLRLCGPALISHNGVLEKVTNLLVATITRKHPCQQDFGDADNLDDLDETSEYDWLVIDTALDAVIGLAVALGPAFGQLYKIFEKPIMKFASSSDSTERSTAIGVIAECIRGMGSAITPHTSGLLKLLLHRLSDEDTETKSNAAFAIGLLQEQSTHDQEILKSFNTILSKLEPLLHTQEARALDNAAGCVSRMIMKHRNRVPIAEVLPALVALLPLKQDFEENEPVYKMIISLYSEAEPTIVSLTPQLVPVFAQALGPPEDQLKDETREQLIELVRFMHSKRAELVERHEVLMALM